MPAVVERVYFFLCLTLGRLLRAAKYSTVRIIRHGDALEVRKRRALYAPLLVWLSAPLVRLLDTGVYVLPHREWEERERHLYWSLDGTSIRVDAIGALVLPRLAGETLAALLENPASGAATRQRAIELAVIALAELHAKGFTHGDAMADNVMVDLEAGVAHWFDFETVHDSRRPVAWRRADDVRALLATCLVRSDCRNLSETLQLILNVYADDGLARLLAPSFTSILRRPLIFHLGQAPLSFRCYREIGRLLADR